MFLTGSNVLADNFGDPKGSQFSDLVVKFYVGSQTYEGTILTNLSRELENNQFEVAVRVPDTLPLGGSRIVLGRKQNEKVSQNPAEPAQEILYNSNSYRIENDTEYVFAAQWGSNRVAVLNGSDPESVVATTNSSGLLIGNIAVGTDDRLDRPRDLTVTSDGSRVYVPLETSGRVALVDPIARQQIDTKPDLAGINPIDLPSGAIRRSIVVDSRDQYAYIADGKAGGNSIYVLDINPSSSKYHKVTQTITVGAAPSGLRQMAISTDGKKLFVTAPAGVNSRIYVVNIDPKDRPRDPSQNPKKWNQLIGTVTADEGVEGLASTVDPLKMTFTNSGKDSTGFGVLDITNNEPLSFAATTRYTNLELGSDLDYFDVNEGVSVTVLPDASYAFVVGRNTDTKFFAQGIPSVDGDPRAGSNIAIIKDPLTNPQVVAATRPIPNGVATDLVLSGDSKYLYASYPNLSGANGKVYVFDTEEFVKTVTNPGQFQIDAKGRGVGLPLFDSTTARNATVADLSRVPIDNINPAVSIAADFQILADANNQYIYGVPPGSKRAPVAATNSRGLAATPLDWLDLTGPGENTNDLTPTFDWNFSIPDSQIREVNLFVSTFPEREGLLPWDQVVNLSEALPDSGLTQEEKRQFLSSPWQEFDDFNPNRILTATWKPAGGWVWNGGARLIGDNNTFTLDPNLTLTAGQTYYWAVEAINAEGERNLEFGEFNTQLGSVLYPFRSVTVLTHGFTPPIVAEAVIPPNFFDIANNIADAEGGGLILRYNKETGFWVPVDKYGVVMPDFPAGQNPETTTNYLEQLATYISDNYSDKSLVLLPDWAQNNESSVPDSGFTEGAADAFYASLVQLDQALGGTIGELDPQGRLRFYDSQGKLIRQQGDLFDSPMHFIGFSRGTVVNSEIVQRLLTAFPNAGGTTQFDQDFQVTTIDPHDFDQESLELPVIGGFRNFYEPKVQTWEGITFADNYYQTTADPNGLLSLTPNGRNIPNLLPPEDNSNQPGLKFPKDANGNLLGVPDVVEFLGTRSEENGYAESRAGFTRQTDAIPLIGGGLGGNHTRVLNWYSGSANLGLRESQPSYAVDWLKDPVYRRRSDGAYEVLFDRDLYDTDPNRVHPWYTPNHTDANFVQGSAEAPWEGIGTGWFYSINGGGQRLRPETQPRVPLSFDNTYSARMRGDAAVPTLFNGNFDAVTDPFGGNLSQVRRNISNALPGWSFHNGQKNPNIDLVQNLQDVKSIKGKSETDYAFKLEANGVREIVHNRFVVPDWGNLRFDVHAPVRSGTLKVKLETLDGKFAIEEEIDLATGIEIPTNTADISQVQSAYLHNQNRVKFGEKGFETFQIDLHIRNDLTKKYRGQPATLKFELKGGEFVYLDNVFFKSDYLKWGNPTEARWDFNDPEKNPYQTNLLLEKPQYASSYNAVTKLPNWVSWQVDNTWSQRFVDRTGYQFIVDPSLPGDRNFPSWPRIDGQIYQGTGWDKGHLIPEKDRNRNEKDALATYMSTNLIPQALDNNRLFRNNRGSLDPDISPAWSAIESGLVSELIFDDNKKLDITAGVFDTKQQNWLIQPKTNAPELLTQPQNQGNTDPRNFVANGIRIPGWTWKTILVSNKSSLGAEDILGSYTYITPNIPEPYREWSGQPAVPNPLNQLLGGDRDPIESAEQWRRPNTWRISINQLESLLNTQGSDKVFNFLSNLPEDVRNRIKKQSDFPFPPP